MRNEGVKNSSRIFRQEQRSSIVISGVLDEALHLLLDLLEPCLGVGRLGGVHLVDGHDQLLDAEAVGETGLELSGAWEGSLII